MALAPSKGQNQSKLKCLPGRHLAKKNDIGPPPASEQKHDMASSQRNVPQNRGKSSRLALPMKGKPDQNRTAGKTGPTISESGKTRWWKETPSKSLSGQWDTADQTKKKMTDHKRNSFVRTRAKLHEIIRVQFLETRRIPLHQTVNVKHSQLQNSIEQPSPSFARRSANHRIVQMHNPPPPERPS